MSVVYRRLQSASLVDPVSDPSDRYELPKSTLIATEEWLLECAWDGVAIGDIHVYKNKNFRNGQRLDPKDDWSWWAGVPRGKVKSYRFEVDDAATMTPSSLGSGAPHGERQKEPGSAGKSARS